MNRIISFFILLFVLLCGSSLLAGTRIFYEDCEDTSFTDHFLEDGWGQSDPDLWDEFTTEISQSATAYAGSYSLTYDPFVTGNPYGRVGRGDVTYGNLSNFDLDAHESRYWYFRWYQRWEDNATYDGMNKTIYINTLSVGTFTFVPEKAGATTIHVTLHRNDTDTKIYEGWDSVADLDDEEWHKMEIFFDVGTTGGGNGDFWFTIDDVLISSDSSLTYNATIAAAPIHSLTGWPSNTSGASGSQDTWLDELEIWTLDASIDYNGAEPAVGSSTPTFSGIGGSGLSLE